MGTVNLCVGQFDGSNLHITGTWRFECCIDIYIYMHRRAHACVNTVLLRSANMEGGTKQGEFNLNYFIVRISSVQEYITKFY